MKPRPGWTIRRGGLAVANFQYARCNTCGAEADIAWQQRDHELASPRCQHPDHDAEQLELF